MYRFDTAHFAVKAQILSSLKYHADEKSPSKRKKAAEASYLLSQCYLNGFGLPETDDSKGLQYLRRAVDFGHSIAREVAFNVCQALGVDMPDIYPAQNVATSARKVRPKEERSPLSENAPIDETRIFMGQVPEQAVHYNEDGDSLLHWAAAHDRPDIAEMILKHQPNLLEANNNLLETPLLFACRHGSTGVSKILLEHGAMTDKISLIGETALHWLVSFPEAEIEAVGNLIFDERSLRSFALSSRASSGYFGDFYICGTPLHRAVALRRLDVVKFLLDRRADPFFAGEILYDQEALAQAGFEPMEANSDLSFLPIHWACRAHDSEMLSVLLEGPAWFQIPDWPSDFELSVSPFAAEGMPRKTLSDWVLPIGITMNRKNRTEFATAAWDYLAKKDDGLGCPIFMSTSLLGYACDPLPRFTRLATYGEKYKDTIKTIDMLEELRGQFLSRVSFSGMTAIMQAVRNSDTETCLYLLAKEDVPEILETSYKGGWGLKPLHVAASKNNVTVFRALLNAGANPRSQRTDGVTALHVIASEYFQDQRLAEELIFAAPDLVHADQALETPFSTAVRNSDFPLADLLRSKGANANQLLGPHHTNTVLLQVLAGSSNSDIDLEPLRYVLAIPELDFVVAPKPRYTALHVAVILPVRYSLEGLTAPSKSNHSIRILLERWHSKSDLMMRDHKGNTALHYAAMFRDFSSTKLLVEAMIAVGAEINTLSDYLGSPVNMSVLDALDSTKNVPSSVTERGEGAVAEWNDQTSKLETILEQHGAKRRSVLLEERWSELSFFDKQKANLLSSQKLAPLAQGIQILDLWWSLGPDVRTTRRRIESERNPEEVSGSWFGS